METKGVIAKHVRTPETTYSAPHKRVPDILSYIQSKVELTRCTIFKILKKSGRLRDFPVNPQRFMDAVVKSIRDVLHLMIIEGIQYEKLDTISYEMSKFRAEEHKLEFAKDRIVETKKSVYNYITYDSGVEKTFAKALESMKNIAEMYNTDIPKDADKISARKAGYFVKERLRLERKRTGGVWKIVWNDDFCYNSIYGILSKTVQLYIRFTSNVANRNEFNNLVEFIC